MPNSQKIKALAVSFGRVLEDCLDLTFIGDKVLRQKTLEVSMEEGLVIADKLKISLSKYRKITGYGRGLAAPQIGENKSVFITFVDDIFKTYINPKVIKSSDKHNLYRESCLSCGFVSVDVKRPVSITIEYTDEIGDIQTETADSFLARLLQHEYDHLQGIVNVDKAEPASIEFMVSDPLQEKLREI